MGQDTQASSLWWRAFHGLSAQHPEPLFSRSSGLLAGAEEAKCLSTNDAATKLKENAMTVRELMERLEELNPDAEIRLMIQRHYPLESHVYGICGGQQLKRGEDDDDDEGSESVIYIVEGQQIGYGLKRAWSAAS